MIQTILGHFFRKVSKIHSEYVKYQKQYQNCGLEKYTNRKEVKMYFNAKQV